MQNPDSAEDRSQVWRELPYEDVAEEIESTLAAANLVLPPVSIAAPSYKEFDSNGAFWHAIFSEEIRSDAEIALRDFFLFEWFPRSPGLFHTEGAGYAREYAQGYLLPLSDEQQRMHEDTAPPDTVVYNLYGKYCMLRGGIGCIRLKPKPTESGLLWFMSASSTLSAHEGVPVAINESSYNQYIEYINEHGVLPCTLVGKLKFLPKPLLSLYQDYTGVAHLYVLVEEITPSRSPLLLREDRPIVSVAVTFSSASRLSEQFRGLSNWEDMRDFGAAYISFAAGTKGSLKRRLTWLEYYVSTLHEGTIVTDFDEHMTRFKSAVFSLDKVCNGRLNRSEVVNVTTQLQIGNADVLIANLHVLQAHVKANQIKIGGVRQLNMGDIFSNIGAGTTIINRSSLLNAMNVVRDTDSADVSKALKELAEFIEQSRNQEAAENFNAFSEELQRPSPRKSLLRSFWNGILAALPTVAELTTAAATVAMLFA